MFLFFLLAAASFLFPVGLYPFQDLTRDFLAAVSLVFLLVVALFKNDSSVCLPRLTFSLIPLVLLFSVYFLTNDGLGYSYYLYALTFLISFFVLIAVSSLLSFYGREKLINAFAFFILVISMLATFLGLSRYYGVMKLFVPWVSVDGNRLIGPFGQPNLMGLLIICGISSLWYLVFIREKISVKFSIVLFLILFYAASLTASRAWLVNFFLFSCLCCFYACMSKFFLSEEKKNVIKKPSISVFIIVVFGIFSTIIVPRIDSIISDPLIESGFVNRIDPEITSDRMKSASSSGRLSEWGKVLSGVAPDSVVFGNGLGRYGEFSNRAELELELQGTGSVWNHAHNIFIMLYIEWGILGVFAILIPFAYIAKIIYRSACCATDFHEFLPVSIIVFFIFHSLVEFSLWYLPFLGIFLFSLASIDEHYKFFWSSRNIPKVISLLILVFVTPVAVYNANDAVKTIKIMYSDRVGLGELWALDDLSRNRIIGYGPMLVMAARFPPIRAGGDRDLKRFEELAAWRPYPLFRVRVSALSTIYRPYEESCRYIEETVALYPDSVSAIQNGIRELEDGGELADFSDCILSGVAHWVEPNDDSRVAK